MKKTLKIFVIFSIVCILWTGIAIATDDKSISDVSVLEKSEDFKRWENLSDEERQNTIQPMYSSIPFKQSVKRSVYNTLLQQSAVLDSKYSIIDNDNINMIVKNQKKVGACWAFAYSSALESTFAKQNKVTTTTAISPMHVDYKTANIYNRKLGSGGSVVMALSYSASEYGPVYESSLPFESVYDETNNRAENYYLKDKSEVALNQESIARIKEINLYTSDLDKEVARQKIKQHIKEEGAVMATIYVDFGITASDEYISQDGFYNSATKAFYCNDETKSINHAVTIVGWDDTFSKDNFATGKQPINNGAWIVLNSYGSEFGENGYFYVSYEDVNIQKAVLGFDDITIYSETTDKEYDYTYQYDELGMSTALNIPYLANVFDKKSIDKQGYAEYLNEVGIQLISAQGIEIYVNASGNDFSKLTKVASYTGENALEAGYHTIKLSTPVKITGDKFIVAVKYINSEEIVSPIECNLKDSGLSISDITYNTAKSNKGESYASLDGITWKDLEGLQVTLTATLANTNACIKAFTVKQEIKNIAVTGVTLDKKTYSIQEGSTANLVATINPTDATNKNVTWKSSNSNIATVSETGVIKGISEGKATITVTTVDGGYTATCEVTVNKKKDDSDDIYVPEKDNNNGDNNNPTLDTDNNENKENIKQPATDKDLTTSNKILPYTGVNTIIILIIAISSISLVIYIKCRKYKDVK